VKCKLIWITPNVEDQIVYIARVSNPKMQGEPSDKLIPYCIRNSHWSIFEMANAVVEIETTRDIARQILRHRSFSFQEFSQRYASVEALPQPEYREARLQDIKNRQNSIEVDDKYLQNWWNYKQAEADAVTMKVYREALEMGIAKEVARAVLPEGLTASRMYMNGTIRSWMHYIKLRSGNGTQKEHIEIAQSIGKILEEHLPLTWKALNEMA
jgi:thymidylate synthase (FAD)